MFFAYPLLRPLLFQLQPETAHHLSFQLLKGLAWWPASLCSFAQESKLQKKMMGLEVRNLLGLAAGLDKNGELLKVWDKLGFGFIEVGTVTPLAQMGNPKPRLFRLVKDTALINRLGFNNLGVDALVENIRTYQGQALLGVNIGKNKDTPNEKADEDYLTCFHKVAPYADYITINISSPNTPGLRELQKADYLNTLLYKLKEAQSKYSSAKKPLPICVKIAPDIEINDLDEMLNSFLIYKIEGVIATNTTIARNLNLKDSQQNEQGGLSGAPLFEKSNQILSHIKAHVGNRITLIGVGGITDGATAAKKLESGADFLQIYTGLIYKGPSLIQEILSQISHKES